MLGMPLLPWPLYAGLLWAPDEEEDEEDEEGALAASLETAAAAASELSWDGRTALTGCLECLAISCLERPHRERAVGRKEGWREGGE
ncbi:hypothetical protein RRG08_007081 [Elysia crispata]|uniref:Uncharacterized protein n=1 Tax=Elysia crispata TaxID=231223 RepID=A0AAE0YPB5_9GAST|nr:hypothetical protein RRG08_007081 [Elysia crispata]